ncbi:hypothetical protein GDO78_020395 [Eleutherodactylus coqui]|uniref:glutathione transferase n=1 Tax=Eleutherodactylus coqui TaxID=57060 RepID=A0A8J6BFQ4_ELECQ|nr:hypothetical protein GDO78_020395 [Eleutherodactylus coqui]
MMILGYWDIRGLCHSLRLLLEYTGTHYEEKRYVTGDGECTGRGEQLKGPYLEKLPTVLARYSQFLGKKNWFVGDKITFADFLMYDMLDQHNMLDPTCLQKFKNLQDFHSRFEALPAIAAYMKTPRFIKTPINNRMAFWANK